jgi:ABC-type glycerol-3-phosphate transport system permease component
MRSKAWNNFFWPLVILRSAENWTLPLGITLFKTQYFTTGPIDGRGRDGHTAWCSTCSSSATSWRASRRPGEG